MFIVYVCLKDIRDSESVEDYIIMKAKRSKKYMSKKLPYSRPDKLKYEKKCMKQTQSLSLLDLNDDCLITIFEFLPKLELVRTETVSKHWRTICLKVWRKVLVLDMRGEIKVKDTNKLRALKELLWRCQHSVKHIILPDYPYYSGLHPKSVFGLIEQFSPNINHLDIGDVKIWTAATFKAIPARLVRNLKSLSFHSWDTGARSGLPLLLEKAKNLVELKFGSMIGDIACLLNLSLNIKNLEISGAGDADLLEQVFQNLPNLQNLSLRCSKFYVKTIASMSDQLVSLSLSSGANFYSGDFYKMTFQNLKKFDLEPSNWVVTDDVIFHISKSAPLLENFNLKGCKELTDKGFLCLVNLKNLKVLNVRSTLISDNAFENIASHLNTLEVINCSSCTNLTDDGLSRIIALLPNLKSLHIGEYEKATEYFFESATESLGSNLNGKKRRLSLYICYNVISVFLDDYPIDRSKMKPLNEVLLKMRDSNLFDLHVYGLGKDVWYLDSDMNFSEV